MRYVCFHSYDEATKVDFEAESAKEAALLYALATYRDDKFKRLKVSVKSPVDDTSFFIEAISADFKRVLSEYGGG